MDPKMDPKTNKAKFPPSNAGSASSGQSDGVPGDVERNNKSAEGGQQKPRTRKVKKQGAYKKPKGAPNRPLSAYNLFFREERVRWLAENERSSLPRAATDNQDQSQSTSIFRAMGKAIGAKWRTLTVEQRAKYTEVADKDKVRYRREMAEYKDKIVRESTLGQAALRRKAQLDNINLQQGLLTSTPTTQQGAGLNNTLRGGVVVGSNPNIHGLHSMAQGTQPGFLDPSALQTHSGPNLFLNAGVGLQPLQLTELQANMFQQQQQQQYAGCMAPRPTSAPTPSSLPTDAKNSMASEISRFPSDPMITSQQATTLRKRTVDRPPKHGQNFQPSGSSSQGCAMPNQGSVFTTSPWSVSAKAPEPNTTTPLSTHVAMERKGERRGVAYGSAAIATGEGVKQPPSETVGHQTQTLEWPSMSRQYGFSLPDGMESAEEVLIRQEQDRLQDLQQQLRRQQERLQSLQQQATIQQHVRVQDNYASGSTFITPGSQQETARLPAGTGAAIQPPAPSPGETALQRLLGSLHEEEEEEEEAAGRYPHQEMVGDSGRFLRHDEVAQSSHPSSVSEALSFSGYIGNGNSFVSGPCSFARDNNVSSPTFFSQSATERQMLPSAQGTTNNRTLPVEGFAAAMPKVDTGCGAPTASSGIEFTQHQETMLQTHQSQSDWLPTSADPTTQWTMPQQHQGQDGLEPRGGLLDSDQENTNSAI